MIASIATRELVTLDGAGAVLHGTYHKARVDGSGSTKSAPASKQIGMLFLNSFSTPRAWFGDTAVYWADAFAAQGYPCFRFDLPGLGDSIGEVPEDLIDHINDGGHADIAVSKTKELVRRFNLSGVLIVGHCAGSITALYAASEIKECKGLILMDPYFHLTKGIRPKLRHKLGDWAEKNKVAASLSGMYAKVRMVRQKIRKHAPPTNANLALLARWQQVASRGLPILLLKASAVGEGGKPRPGQFDYLKHLLVLAGRASKVAMHLIENTDHCFADLHGRSSVQQLAKCWLAEYFPQAAVADLESISDRAQCLEEEECNFSPGCLPA